MPLDIEVLQITHFNPVTKLFRCETRVNGDKIWDWMAMPCFDTKVLKRQAAKVSANPALHTEDPDVLPAEEPRARRRAPGPGPEAQARRTLTRADEDSDDEMVLSASRGAASRPQEKRRVLDSDSDEPAPLGKRRA